MKSLLTNKAISLFIKNSSYMSSQTRSMCMLNLNNNIKSDEPRERMDFDVVIVGGGPAGLSTAIRLKQLEAETGKPISVCVVEKAAEIGAHILSGNVFEPRALNELFPNWKDKSSGLTPFGDDPTEAKEDHFLVCPNNNTSIRVPNMFLPPMLHNEGNFIISLSQFTRWLGKKAEEVGVEIYPGFPASEVIFNESKTGVLGIITKDMGISKKGEKKDTFMRGMELYGKQVVFAEGARGSCSEDVIRTLSLRKGKQLQSYGLGLKEVWEIPEADLQPGLIQHTLGWPLDLHTYGGSFLYHMKPNYILLGFVVGLDYKNPYLNLYKEFQRVKTHKDIHKHIKNGTCVSYGARVINEGGFQSIPKLTFPGGVLVGCSAGLLNVPKIKGTHLAMKSGILAAESIFSHVSIESQEPNCEVSSYQKSVENSWIWEELKSVRNYAPSFKHGTIAGTIYSGISGLFLKGREPWTIYKSKTETTRDCDKTEEKNKHKVIEYPKPDGRYTFDILENLQRSGTNHDHDQPSHLVVKQEKKQVAEKESLEKFDGPEQRFCPAKVYEYVEGKLVINAQNCVHCKCCSIKTPEEFIHWTTPEGGQGPAYTIM